MTISTGEIKTRGCPPAPRSSFSGSNEAQPDEANSAQFVCSHSSSATRSLASGRWKPDSDGVRSSIRPIDVAPIQLEGHGLEVGGDRRDPLA